jgi:hypothetical protein
MDIDERRPPHSMACIAFRLAKYLAKYVAKFRQKGRELGNHLHHQLCRSFRFDLNLYLNLNLNLPLYRALFATFNPQLSKSLLAAMFGSLLPALAFDFYLLTFDFFYGLMLPPRQPVGRPLHGRIVVSTPPYTTCCGSPRPRLSLL